MVIKDYHDHKWELKFSIILEDLKFSMILEEKEE